MASLLLISVPPQVLTIPEATIATVCPAVIFIPLLSQPKLAGTLRLNVPVVRLAVGGTAVGWIAGFFVAVGVSVLVGGIAVVGSGAGVEEGGSVFVGEGTATVRVNLTACSTAAVEV